MEILIALVIGVVVGLSSQLLIGKDTNTVAFNVLVALCGSLLGLGVYYFILADGAVSGGLINGPAVICSAIGALVCMLSFSAIHKAVSGPEETGPKTPEPTEKRSVRKLFRQTH
jgi:uncharacterized membrane protein YeaQ/YmgE (transglycosylase-associated protein family)